MLKMDLDDFAKSYLTLALRINKHINGYVEHYYGPPEIKNKVDLEEKLSPKFLTKECQYLLNHIKDQGFEEKRYIFLEKSLIAIQTILLKLIGEKIPYLEQVERLFDFSPILYDEDKFYALSTEAEEIYKGEGTISNRMRSYVQRRKIHPRKIKSMMLKSINIVRKRTKEIFPNLLPNHEKIILNEVKNKSWPMYNWYQGNYTSRLDINISTIHYWTNLINYACHEGYPGHHTECSVRNHSLFNKKGYFETSILIIYTPEMVIHEGMGEMAEKILFSPYQSNKILLEEFCPNPSIEDNIETLIKQNEIRNGFKGFNYNLAYFKYEKGWADEDLVKYIRNFKVIPENSIKAMLRFISDELWAPYVPVYQGEQLIIKKFGANPSPSQFQELIINQTLPSDLI